MSQKRFSERVGINPRRLSDIETGSPIRLEELCQIINALREVAFHKIEPRINLTIPKQLIEEAETDEK